MHPLADRPALCGVAVDLFGVSGVAKEVIGTVAEATDRAQAQGQP
jgi:hypothetical protein